MYKILNLSTQEFLRGNEEFSEELEFSSQAHAVNYVQKMNNNTYYVVVHFDC